MIRFANQQGRRLKDLEKHLQHENPLLVDTVRSFRQLDKIAHRMALLDRERSFATQIAWWPLVSVLGTFSAGKSTFINHYLQYDLQRTGAQAVDDKFTVICFSRDRRSRALPGTALDSDPRFPFYKISQVLEKVNYGEGARVDAYLQMKTCPCDALRGSILIDSPGFDADAQRTATLRITDHIIDLSDLVLVFFDARHPEPGAMQDTLKHLVANTIRRNDSSKFLYILNQIDTTAREDNPEEVIGAWQRAIAHEGLTAGKFYCIYNPDAAIPIQDEALRRRYERKRDVDIAEIHDRIRQVGVERAYRIIAALKKTAKEIDEKRVPQLRDLLKRWRRGVLRRDAAWLGAIVVGLLALFVGIRYWQDTPLRSHSLSGAAGSVWIQLLIALLAAGTVAYIHLRARKQARQAVMKHIQGSVSSTHEREILTKAFLKNTRLWRSVFSPNPAGWNKRIRTQLLTIVADADRYTQQLNDRFANPSGESGQFGMPPSAEPAEPEAPPIREDAEAL
jgi:hypothetical protein